MGLPEAYHHMGAGVGKQQVKQLFKPVLSVFVCVCVHVTVCAQMCVHMLQCVCECVWVRMLLSVSARASRTELWLQGRVMGTRQTYGRKVLCTHHLHHLQRSLWCRCCSGLRVQLQAQAASLLYVQLQAQAASGCLVIQSCSSLHLFPCAQLC